MAFRKRQPYTDNFLMPCSIIDNPHILREIVEETGAYPTHKGAETIITTLAEQLDAYSEEWGKYANKAWESEYVQSDEDETAEQKIAG